MNSAGVVDAGGPGGSPGDFNPHDPSHFAPDLTYPGAPFGGPPSSGGVGGATGGVDGRRLNAQSTINQRASRKRKSPPGAIAPNPDQQAYSQQEFSPGAVDGMQSQDDGDQPLGLSHTGRPLNPGKRAEQNRKAQRAFRERREQHVKELEARSQLLDAALASADEANRRWEECRTMLDQLRVENAALRGEIQNLRAALGNAVSAVGFQHVQQGHPAGNGDGKDNKDD